MLLCELCEPQAQPGPLLGCFSKLHGKCSIGLVLLETLPVVVSFFWASDGFIAEATRELRPASYSFYSLTKRARAHRPCLNVIGCRGVYGHGMNWK